MMLAYTARHFGPLHTALGVLCVTVAERALRLHDAARVCIVEPVRHTTHEETRS